MYLVCTDFVSKYDNNNMLKYTNYTLKKLETIFEEQEFTVRYEKGSFQSGYCWVKNQSIVILNKFFDTEAKINCLIDILGQIDVKEDKMSKKSAQFFHKMLPQYQEQKK